MKRFVFSIIIMLFACGISHAQNIIEPELQAILDQKDDETISVNIIFKSQLNVEELNQRTNHFIDKNIKRKNVIAELKNFSEESQQEVLYIIKSAEDKKQASNIICHWLSNSITCMATKDVIEKLAKRDDILLIGLNADRNALLEYYGQETTGYRDSRGAEVEITNNVTQVNAPQVWEQGYTGKGVLVAILDTGVNYKHPDLADHLWDGGSQYPNHGYNSYDGSNVTMDNRGHGTHCAGTICGDGTSGKHTGIAPETTLMCIKALNDEGSANANSICSGIEFAVEHGADVLSMSLGIKNSSVSDRTMIRQTCVNALQAGVIASVAAGNEGSTQSESPVPNNVRVPGSCPAPWIHPDQQENSGSTSCVVSVGAVNKNDKVASLSSRGPVTWQNTSFADYPYNPGIGLIRPDVCAPGVDIVSLSHIGNDYTKMSGTSMATPCVAGIMSLMLSKNPELTPAEISMLLETSAVKLTEKKSNDTGSGRVDALAAINAIDMGSIVFKEMTFSDDNNNGKINPGEEISFDLTFENTSSETIDNITAKLTCDNEWINITKAESEIASIAANGTIAIEDAFTILIDKNAESKTQLFFDVEFYENNVIISKTRFDATIFGSTIKYASMEIEESGKMNITLNNEGNEIALGLTAILSSDSELIDIYENEVKLNNDIAPDGSASVLFGVRLSENAAENFNIPLKLEVKDKFNNVSIFDINYKNSCDIIYTLKDEYGDGWNGAKIIAKYNEGGNITTEDYTITNGSNETFTKTLKSGTLVTLEWKKGGVDTECSYSVHYDTGIEIFSGKGKQNGEFFQWSNDCSCQNMIIETCDNVENLNISIGKNSVTLNWEKPISDAIAYEIYRETELLAITEELSYTDENLTSGTYRYNVRAVFDYDADSNIDCYGSTVSKEITFYENINETSVPNITIYPNPSEGIFTIQHNNIESITLYNIMGSKILEVDVDADEYVICDLDTGIYFVNIKTNVGSVVKKIVKY